MGEADTGVQSPSPAAAAAAMGRRRRTTSTGKQGGNGGTRKKSAALLAAFTIFAALMCAALMVATEVLLVNDPSILRSPEPAAAVRDAAVSLLRNRMRGRQRVLPPPVDKYADPALYADPEPIDGFGSGPSSSGGPADTYPRTAPLPDLLRAWPIGEPPPPAYVYDSLKHFDWRSATDRAEALAYREAEVPFVAHHVPAVEQSSKKWSWKLLEEMLPRDIKHVSQWAKDNLMMYWSISTNKLVPKNYEPPTTHRMASFPEWLEFANRPQDVPSTSPHALISVKVRNGTATAFIGDDLAGALGGEGRRTLFDTLPDGHGRGEFAMCLFSMLGNVAGPHYDMTKNVIAQVKGQKRYIIMPPRECRNLYLHESMHPSERQMRVEVLAAISDTATLDHALREYPDLASARALEVVLSPGQVLYLPALWNHFIVSLNSSVQCGARSAHDWDKEMALFYKDDLKRCSWPPLRPCRTDDDCVGAICLPKGLAHRSDSSLDSSSSSSMLCHLRVGQRCPRSQGHICETGICAGAEHSDDGYDTCRIAGGSECSSDSQCESDLCRNFVCIS